MAKRYGKPKKGDEKPKAKQGEDITRWLISSGLTSKAVTEILLEKGVITSEELDKKIAEITGEGE